jgi:hypothetical protein
MGLTSQEKQRAFRERMYAAGYKQVQIWVLRKVDGKKRQFDRNGFLRKLDELTAGWSRSRLAKLFSELIKITEKRKEEAGQKKNHQY